MELIAINIWVKFFLYKNLVFILIYFIGIAKREEIIDESNLSEQELTAYERDLQEDTKDLRGAITEEDGQ